MSASSSSSYHSEDGLERAVIDLVRVGTRGHGAGVRQLASRLMRSVPLGVSDTEAFRGAVHDAVAPSASSAGLRFTPGSLPTEGESALPLVDVDLLPDGEGLVLEPAVMSQLEEVVAERRRADDLRRAGVGLTRSILLSGSPGVGKTMAARWLASELRLPLVSLDLSTVVSSYLGTSGRNIKSVLDYAKSGPCVLLLDEFDAIAKRRDDEADIEELKRIVNVVLVELDRWPDTSLLVAATNHPQLLDAAIERRFDRALLLTVPGREQRRTLLAHLAGAGVPIDSSVLDLVTDFTEGMSGSDLTRLWALALRRAVLQDAPPSDVLVYELARLAGDSTPARDKLFQRLHDTMKLSNRQIAALTGVSHPTVAAGLERAGGAQRGTGRAKR